MNFFKLYIGDYQRDTAHLSVTEHGAYMLMLQHYYATEKPLPIGKALHRMLRAQEKVERDAIDSVAQQFWRTTPDGIVNDRADEEIAKARAQADTNRRTATAREAKRKAQRTEHESCNESCNELSTNRATNDQPNHSHSQTPDTRGRGDTPLKPPAWSAPSWVPAEQWANFVLHRKAMRGVPFTTAARDGVIAELRKLSDAGHDPAELLATAITRGWRTVFPPRANGASAAPVGAMSGHGMQTMRNAEALAARLFKDEPAHEA